MADYEAGDVVFHNPFIIHASCVNQDPGNTIMIHTDIRFVNPEEPFDTRWTEHWMREYRRRAGAH
jgi:phytanoyl-CoA hydroxylase